MSTSFLPVTNKIFGEDQMPDDPVPRIMLVDMNSFFASVEQQANPKYRGRALGVCASMHPTSCLIAASKEAKKLGIGTGTLVYEAKKICPEIVLTEAEPRKYREVNRKINKIFDCYSDRIERYSIDESFIDFSGSGISPVAAGAEIKRRIREEAGEWLTCSVGIAPNKFMAKLAADMQKPDGLSVVWRKNLPQLYQGKSFRDLWGVARGWERRLVRLGIPGPLEMLSYPVGNLLATFGKPGFYIWQRIRGLEVDAIEPSVLNEERGNEADRPKSFGHSWVLNFRTADKELLAPVIMRLAEKAARRMRASGFAARRVYLSVTDTAGNRFHTSKTLRRIIHTGQELYEESLNLWRNWEFKIEVMHIAVGFTALAADTMQLDLFGDRKPGLVKALDSINNRYGEFTIRSGLLAHTADFAPDAIAFGR